jgi:hypothetical protein
MIANGRESFRASSLALIRVYSRSIPQPAPFSFLSAKGQIRRGELCNFFRAK